MKLLNDFYTITQSHSDEGNVKVSIALNAAHHIYKCHFPNNPITPGVCILQILSELVCLYHDAALTIKGYANVKYLSVISPIDNPTIDIDFSITAGVDGQTKVKAVFKSTKEVFAKISAIYE